MLKDITDGISIKLNNAFGEGYEIYVEDVEQGLNEPCFFIKSLPIMNKPLLNKRKQRTYSFDIAYFPLAGNEEMMDMSDKIIDALECITLLNEDVLRGLDLEAEIVDGVLHISVKYIVFINDYTTEESMDGISANIGMKG